MNPIADFLNRYPLLILDGALATELERHGCDLRDPLWSAKALIEAPGLIKRVHAAYLAVGANCVTTAKPIVVYPNSGETYRPEDNGWTGAGECDAYPGQAQTWYERGARLIGGCCRTTPDEIRALADWAPSRGTPSTSGSGR